VSVELWVQSVSVWCECGVLWVKCDGGVEGLGKELMVSLDF